MSIRIEIKSTHVTEQNGTSKAGKPYSIRKQTAWAHVTDKEGKPMDYPARIEVQLDREQAPFAAGNYGIGPASFFVGDYDRLSLGSLVLLPLKSAA